MLELLLPGRADNAYRGHRLALWLLGLLLLVKVAIGLGSIFNGRAAASGADGLPIDTYTPAGARTVVALFALIGLANVIICAVGAVVLVRYRSLVPLMLTLLLAQQVGRYLILQYLPIARTGAPPGAAINLALLGAMIAGLALSLWARGGARSSAAVGA